MEPISEIELQHLGLPAGCKKAVLPKEATSTPIRAMYDIEANVRLPWAREPNGNTEHDLQPQGYAAAAGTLVLNTFDKFNLFTTNATHPRPF